MTATGTPLRKNAGYNKQNNSYDVSPFIRDYLSVKQKKITGMKDIYTEFKAYAEKSLVKWNLSWKIS